MVHLILNVTLRFYFSGIAVQSLIYNVMWGKIIHNHKKSYIFLDVSFSHLHYSKSELSFMSSTSLWRDGPWHSVPAHSQGSKREIDIVIIVIDYMNLLSTFPFAYFIHSITCRNINLESVWFVISILGKTKWEGWFKSNCKGQGTKW